MCDQMCNRLPVSFVVPSVPVQAGALHFVTHENAAPVLCQFVHDEPQFFAIQRLLEAMMDAAPGQFGSLDELVGEIVGLPCSAVVKSPQASFLPVVELATHVGKCHPIGSAQKGRPWVDSFAFGYWQFQYADILWTVERHESQDLAFAVASGSRKSNIFPDQYTLRVWMSVVDVEKDRDLPGIMEQAMLFLRTNDYVRERFGLDVERRVAEKEVVCSGERLPKCNRVEDVLTNALSLPQ